MFRYRFSLLLLVLVALASVSIRAQEVEDTIKIKTRVVFLDALVKDKKTSLPISNLTQENFEVLDDGKPREISYFTREGEARKPLALVLILDLREDGAGRFLKEEEILKSMENELAKLPPGDEVAILAMNIGEDEQRVWLSEFTNERAKLAEALKQVQAICLKNAAPHSQTTADSIDGAARAVKKEVVSTEVNKGRNGSVVTRKTMSDGSVDVTRVSRNGKMSIELGEVYDMAAAVREATRKAQDLRPNSQMSLVWVSDGIAPIFFEDRDATQEIITRENVIFNSLTVELRTLFKFLLPVAKPIGGWMGMSLYGSAKQLAQRSGGEAVKVGRVKDYGAGLARIIGNLTARYSLGFTLAENETDDGRLHHLEVRVKASDEKGKKRKLQISSRQGYYMAYPPITQKQ